VRGVDRGARDRGEESPGAVRAPLEQLHAAVLQNARAEPQAERAVGRDPRELVILEHALRRAAHDVDPIEVEELLVARVVREQHLAREALAHFVDPGAHAARRREGYDRAVAEVHARGAPVLVAVALLEEHDVAVRVGPLEEGADRPIGHTGEWPRGAEIADRRHPKVSHAVDRGDVGDRGAVE
jgi:hypothetical protein